MARMKRTRRRSREPTDIVGISRCKFPAERAPDGTQIEVLRDVEFASVIQFLESAPGYQFFKAGRGVFDTDEIIFITTWEDEDSVRKFISSQNYKGYLRALGLDDNNADASCPALSVAELTRGMLPGAGIATIYTFGFAYPIAPGTPIDLRGLRPHIPYEIYDPGRLGGLRKSDCGWILDPQLVDGRLVKKAMTLKTWAHREPLQKQLEVYRAVGEHLQASMDWIRKIEALRPLCLDEATWDFTAPEEPDSEPEPEPEEAGLDSKLGQMKIAK